MIRRASLLALALASAGCAQGPREVRMPIPVACAPASLPAEPETISPRLTGNAERDIGIVAASALRLRQWGRELRAMLEACRTDVGHQAS